MESLHDQSYTNYEIIVVNGPSTDETDNVLKRYSNIKVILQKELNGLSFARNLGIRVSKGEIIAFIDDDAVANVDWIKLIASSYTDSKIGGVGGLVYGPGKTHFQFDNGVIDKCGIPDAIRNLDKTVKKGEYSIMMGTNCSFRKSVIYEVGGFDPYFRYYHDESELCVRVIKAGYTIMYQRDAFVVHYMVEGHNRKSPYDLNWSEIVKNVIYYTMKNFGDEAQSYTTRPACSMYLWLKRFRINYTNREISFGQFTRICIEVIKGSMRGYKDGVIVNFTNNEKNKNFIREIPEDMIMLNEPSKDLEKSRKIPDEEGNVKDFSCLKIAYISQEYSNDCGGGNCFHTKNLSYGFTNWGHQVHVIALSEKQYDYDYMDDGVHVHKVIPHPVDFLNLAEDMHVSKKNIAFSYSATLKLFELKKKFGIQIVEAPLWDAQGFVSSLTCPVPLVVRLVTPLCKFVEIQGLTIIKDLKLANWLEGETLRRSDLLIAISSNIGNLISEHHNIPNMMITYGPLGIKLPDKNLLNTSQQNEKLNILYVGRLEKRKGVETLFRSIPQVVEKVPNVTFTIAGNDTDLTPAGESYKKYILTNLDNKYHKYINFTGFVTSEKLQNLYRFCDIFVAPSLYESFGQIYIEAMAWGKPVIGCNVGGVPEVIENGNTGFVITPNDDKELAERIIELEDKDLRRRMGLSGREKVEKNFSIENMVANTYNIYTQVINGRKKGAPKGKQITV